MSYKYISLHTFLFSILAKAATSIKVSFILGSYTVLFSATSIVVPLTGAFAGYAGSFSFLGFSLLIKFLFNGSIPLYHLAYHIPGFIASLYWASGSFAIRFLVPFVSLFLFWVHPIGAQAWPYALYWLIPLALYVKPRKTLFFQALGSTLVAHAVGSVIWLYTVPMTPGMWLALIPLVALERLVFATGMVALFKTINYFMLSKTETLNDQTFSLYYGWQSKMGQEKGVDALERA